MGTVMQRELFDAKAAQRGRVRGMDLAAQNRRILLEAVQVAVENIAMGRESREASADDGQKWLSEHGYRSGDLGNAAGKMFRKTRWEFVRFTHSGREIGHGNLIRVWRLR